MPLVFTVQPLMGTYTHDLTTNVGTCLRLRFLSTIIITPCFLLPVTFLLWLDCEGSRIGERERGWALYKPIWKRNNTI